MDRLNCSHPAHILECGNQTVGSAELQVLLVLIVGLIVLQGPPVHMMLHLSITSASGFAKLASAVYRAASASAGQIAGAESHIIGFQFPPVQLTSHMLDA